ncbi:MAG: leucine-rich repeat domain-containing protein [Clostridia bacterium]|nr:leucine-rich repeat domain-containing protein [Clostridia bacterium]
MRNKKGITLIALIITIIVMLILVGVTVNVALNGGLFDIAKQATSGMTMAQIKERAEVVKAILVADAQTDNTIRLSKQEYRDRLLQEFEGSTADGYKVIVDERYVINIQNIKLDISVTDLNQQENTNEFNLKELTTLIYTTSNVEKDEKIYITNVDLTLTKAAFTRAEYVEYKLAENSALEERTQEEKNKIALEYAASTWYGTEEKFETLDDGVIYAVNDYYGTTYTTIEECLADEYVQTEWGKTIGQLYYNFYYYEIVNTVPELTEQETLDLLYQEAYEEELNAIGREYLVEYNRYASGLKLYVSKDGGEEKLVTTAGISIALADRTVNYSILENGTYEFVLRTNATKEEILREKIEVRDMATDKNPYYVTAEDAEGVWTTDGAGTITGYLGTDTDVTIPIRIGEESITKIGDDAFESNTNLVNVNINDNITSIGKRAFYRCTLLKTINIPESVKNISDFAFYDCESIESIELPNSITIINGSTFQQCKNLKEIVLPNKLKTIGGHAFSGCAATVIDIPETVTTIGIDAFSVSGLTEIEIPNGVKVIDLATFYGCKNLKSIKLPESVTTIKGTAFAYCTSLEEITIPNSVTSISIGTNEGALYEATFVGCTNLTTINFAPGDNPIPEGQPWGAPNENVKVTKLTQTTSEE